MSSPAPGQDPDFWRNIVANAPTVIIVADSAGTITYCNHTVSDLKMADVIGSSVLDFVSDAEKPIVKAAVTRVVTTKQATSYYVYSIGEDGSAAWYATRLGPISPGNADQLILITMDITEQRRLETQVRERNQQLLSFLDHIPAVVWIKDSEMRYLYVNAAYEKSFDLPHGSCIGKTAVDIWPADIAARFDEANQQVLKLKDDLRVIETTKSGGDIRHWMVTKFLIQPETNKLLGGIAFDITEAKKAEKERQDLDRKLFETQKLESLGVLAGGVAHDFNNLLAIILGNINIARWHSDRGIAIEPQLQTIETIAMQAAAICRQLLTYAGRKTVEKTLVDLNRALLDVRDLLRSSWKSSARVSERFQNDLPMISGDDVQLRQIFLNLMMNALEAVGSKEGEVRLSTGVTELDQATIVALEISPVITPGSYVYASVRDDGSGMSPQTKARIFDPFFSTKFTGRGLGLAAVMGIVRNHSGGIRVETQADSGSTFTVYFPKYTPNA